ncbi:MAG: threo-3-hydroxy-L-aspartate ammonia-lyase [Fimbriimonadaceae bacterium]|nr:threo-3-hydroxy-L-aspartate ammonia-lyase [Fimbriimonadaceae bacterium]
MPVTYDDVVSAAERLCGVAAQTPVFTSRTLDGRLGAHVFFKAESFQRVGAFKFRGAYNTLSRLDDRARRNGVLTFSSGNHAQAVALAGRLLNIPTVIVMPFDAPAVKVEGTRGYGGEVVLYHRDETTREALGQRLAEERGLTVVHPYDHDHVIAGQGTVAKELIEEVGELDLLLAPVGGGGLLAGSALSARALSPRCRVIGVEPAAGDDAARSFRSGTIQTSLDPVTIADGARTPCIGERNFAIIRRDVSDIVTVEDGPLLPALRFLWERMKLVIEPTAALPVAALLEGIVSVRAGQRVGVILSGGNVDLAQMGDLFAHG